MTLIFEWLLKAEVDRGLKCQLKLRGKAKNMKTINSQAFLYFAAKKLFSNQIISSGGAVRLECHCFFSLDRGRLH